MSSCTVYVVVEGMTEFTFVREVLAPAIGHKGVFLHPVEIGRPRHRGGDIRFVRAANDIGRYLKQQADAYVTSMLDFFRIGSDWPGLHDVRPEMVAREKAALLEKATTEKLTEMFPNLNIPNRFIPYLSMHEFEALLYSDAGSLASGLGVNEAEIISILEECAEPEEINEGPNSAPSKRLLKLKPNYLKVSMGKSIAETIGVSLMREKCPHFDTWLRTLEGLQISDL